MSADKPEAPIRIAIVEDDPALRKMLVSLLQADTRYAVVAEIRRGPTRRLPRSAPFARHRAGGPRPAGYVRHRRDPQAQESAVPGLHVLVITTFGDEKTMTAALQAGADGYLLKGIALEELGATSTPCGTAARRSRPWWRASCSNSCRPSPKRRRRRRRHNADPARARNPGNDRQGLFLHRDLDRSAASPRPRCTATSRASIESSKCTPRPRRCTRRAAAA